MRWIARIGPAAVLLSASAAYTGLALLVGPEQWQTGPGTLLLRRWPVDLNVHGLVFLIIATLILTKARVVGYTAGAGLWAAWTVSSAYAQIIGTSTSPTGPAVLATLVGFHLLAARHYLDGTEA